MGMRASIWLGLALTVGCTSPADPGDPSEPPARPRDACTDGVDCLCDALASDPDIAFCEDFEDPGYNAYPDHAGYFDNHPFALRYNAVNYDEGVCDDCAYNIVETDDGQCEVPGERDCVLDGNQALGHRFRPGNTGGIIAEHGFSVNRTFGVTYAFKFSDNFVDPTTALKSNEFGSHNASCILGCSTWNAGERNLPFNWAFVGTFPDAEVLVGTQEQLGIGRAFGVAKTEYEWRGTMRAGDDPDKVVAAPGQWVCQQTHFRNWGTADTEVRSWINGKLVQHIRHLDMTGMLGPDGKPSPDIDDPGQVFFNHYYNDGYGGADIAYRYEDNFVITRADEPVSCDAIAAGEL